MNCHEPGLTKEDENSLPFKGRGRVGMGFSDDPPVIMRPPA